MFTERKYTWPFSPKVSPIAWSKSSWVCPFFGETSGKREDSPFRWLPFPEVQWGFGPQAGGLLLVSPYQPKKNNGCTNSKNDEPWAVHGRSGEVASKPRPFLVPAEARARRMLPPPGAEAWRGHPGDDLFLSRVPRRSFWGSPPTQKWFAFSQ